MADLQMGAVESRFADIIWEHEPLFGRVGEAERGRIEMEENDIVHRFEKAVRQGIFKNNKGTVTSVISRREFYSMQSEKFVDETFDGSLPAFLTAFTSRKHLTPEEVAHLRRMVAEYEEEG